MKRTLDWETVKERRLNVTFLSDKAGLSKEDFLNLQPVAAEWVQNNLCCLQDCTKLSLLPLNPLKDLKVTVDKLLEYNSKDLLSFGVTYDEMKASGMTPVMMGLFHFPLSEWIDLGFSKLHVQGLSSHECNSLFGMGVEETMKYMEEG